MRGDGRFAEPVGQVARDPLGEPARIDEDQRRAMLFDQLGEPVVDLAPDFLRHHRLERRIGHLERDVALARVAVIDDRAFAPRADQILADLLDRLLRRRKPDAHERLTRERIEPLEREREMRAALVRRDRVDLVDDDAARTG